MAAKTKTRREKPVGIEKLYDHLPKTKEGRTMVALVLICIGLFASGAILTIILIPLGIVVLAYDYEWARNILRRFRDWLNGVRDRSEKKGAKRY